MDNRKLFQYSKIEEWINGSTHLVGVGLGIFILSSLLYEAILKSSVGHIISGSVYGVSFIILFLSSSLYHLSNKPHHKRFLKKCDHASIYIFMAGTYTPFVIHYFESSWKYYFLGAVWLIAITGAILKFFNKQKNIFISVGFYISFGLLFLVAREVMTITITPTSLNWLIAGGVLFVTGTIFYVLKKIPYTHGIWHLFVLGGVFSHYIALVQN